MGIEPCEIEEKAFEYLYGAELEYHDRRKVQLILQELNMGQSNFAEKEEMTDFTPRTGKIIPRVSQDFFYSEMRNYALSARALYASV